MITASLLRRPGRKPFGRIPMRPCVLSAVLLGFLLAGAGAHAQGTLPASRAGGAIPAKNYEQALTLVLEKAVTADGLVRYDLLRGPLKEAFSRVLRAIEDHDARRLRTEDEKLAFWMNAYNVQMLQNIIESPGVTNVTAGQNAERFFKRPLRTAGIVASLDQIEQVILRRQPGPAGLLPLQVSRVDPRIHVGLNCAARSCPPLQRRAFTAASVDAMLDEAMRTFADGDRHLRITADRLVLSSLLDWYGADFDLRAKAGDYLISFMSPDRPGYAALRRLLAGRTAAQLKSLPDVSFEYDWRLNDAVR